MAVSLLSFELCNSKLLARDMLIDMPEYISITHAVPLNLPIVHKLSDIAGLIYFMVDITTIQPHEFAIPVYTLEQIGFFVKDTFQNRIKQLFNQPRDNLENELGFLKRNGLKTDIDFELTRMRISSTGDELDIEYRITTLAFYKLIVRKYNQLFLTTLNARVFQIISNYQTYVAQYYENKVHSLDATIHGLVHDINRLTTEYPDIKKNAIFQRRIDRAKPSSSLDNRESFISGSYRDSYISHASVEDAPDQDDGLWTPNNQSPVSVLMESPRLSEQMQVLHSSVMNIISSPHESLDAIQANFITNDLDSTYARRDSIPISMLGEDFERVHHGDDHQTSGASIPYHDLTTHVDMLQQRFRTMLNQDTHNLRETMPIYLTPDRPYHNMLPRKKRHSAYQ